MKNSILPLLAIVLSLAVSFPGAVRAHGDKPHGSHDAAYGGLVMMYVDLHFEVVLEDAGGVKIYYSDAARDELPASVVSDAKVEILRDGADPETVVMAISDAGDFWEGASTPVTKMKSVVRVSFVFQGEPLVFDLPAHMFPSIKESKRAERAAHEA